MFATALDPERLVGAMSGNDVHGCPSRSKEGRGRAQRLCCEEDAAIDLAGPTVCRTPTWRGDRAHDHHSGQAGPRNCWSRLGNELKQVFGAPPAWFMEEPRFYTEYRETAR